jgi:hypothetical protein
VPCTPIASSQYGSTCTVSTTAESLVPGAIKEGGRAVWALGQVQVFDGGADAEIDTADDNTLFAVQGAFVP